MWGLFTRALTLASSTVRVSILNTSANFIITAVLGLAIFSESLPGLWWLGAALLVAGSVIIGRREEGSIKGTEATVGAEPLLHSGGDVFRDDDEERDREHVELDHVMDGDKSSDDEDGVLK